MGTTVQQLVQARDDYLRAVEPCYDDTLRAVSAAVATSNSIGKADIGALVFWKRLRADTPWASTLQSIAESKVRAHTAEAVTAVRDTGLDLSEAARRGRSALAPLPGFARGDALASALLVAAAPDRMAVYDGRAQVGLEQLGIRLTSAPRRYARYMDAISDLVAQLAEAGHQWTPRQVDTALFWLGRP